MDITSPNASRCSQRWGGGRAGAPRCCACSAGTAAGPGSASGHAGAAASSPAPAAASGERRGGAQGGSGGLGGGVPEPPPGGRPSAPCPPQGGGGGLPAGQASRDRPGSASQPSAQPAGRTAPRLGRQPLAALLRRSCALPRCPRCSRYPRGLPRGLPRRRPGSGPSPRRRAGGGAAGHCACAARSSINGP